MLWRRISPSVQTSTIAEGYWIARLERSGSTSAGLYPGVAVDPATGNTAMMNTWGGVTPAYIIVNLFDNDGALIWSVELTHQSSAYARSLVFDTNGDLIVFFRRTVSDLDVQLIRLNASDGSVDTDGVYSSVGTDSPGGAAIDGSGNYVSGVYLYVVSTTNDLTTNNFYFKEASSYGSTMFPQIAWTKTGGSVVAIGSMYTNGGSTSFYDSKPIVSVINASGTIQWRKVVTNTITSNDERGQWGGFFISCYVDSDDSVYCGSTITAFSTGQTTTRHIVKFDSTGSVVWQREYSSTDSADYTSTNWSAVLTTTTDKVVYALPPRAAGRSFRVLSKSTGAEESATFVSGGGYLSSVSTQSHDTYVLAVSTSGAYVYVYRLPADLASLQGNTYNGITFENDTTTSWTPASGSMTFGTPSVVTTTTGLSYSVSSPTDATSSTFSGVTDTAVSIP